MFIKESTFWYMFQPILCFLGIHDWYKDSSMVRKCEYCNRKEKFKGIGENRQPIWEEMR